MRLLADQEHVPLESNHPEYLMKALFSLGIINREDYNVLREGMHFRNLIAHGYRSPGETGDMTVKLLTKVEEFLQTELEPASA